LMSTFNFCVHVICGWHSVLSFLKSQASLIGNLYGASFYKKRKSSWGNLVFQKTKYELS
jgi:dolichol kinase